MSKIFNPFHHSRWATLLKCFQRIDIQHLALGEFITLLNWINNKRCEFPCLSSNISKGFIWNITYSSVGTWWRWSWVEWPNTPWNIHSYKFHMENVGHKSKNSKFSNGSVMKNDKKKTLPDTEYTIASRWYGVKQPTTTRILSFKMITLKDKSRATGTVRKFLNFYTLML